MISCRTISLPKHYLEIWIDYASAQKNARLSRVYSAAILDIMEEEKLYQRVYFFATIILAYEYMIINCVISSICSSVLSIPTVNLEFVRFSRVYRMD